MFRPVIQKTRTLIVMASVNLLLVFWVFNSIVVEKSPSYDEKISAAKTMKKALSVLKEFVKEKEMPIYRSIDPNMTGLIFKEESLIRSSDGNLEDKQSTLKPNFAALVINEFEKAGLQKGDTVAISMTGSMPGANIAVLMACEAMSLHYVSISSLGASTSGATDMNLSWPKMEKILYDKKLI